MKLKKSQIDKPEVVGKRLRKASSNEVPEKIHYRLKKAKIKY